MPPRLTDEQARAAMLAVGLEPLEAYPGANFPWRCRCDRCKRETSPRYASIRDGGGCGWCSGNRIGLDDAVGVMRNAGLEPLESYPGRTKAWRCR